MYSSVNRMSALQIEQPPKFKFEVRSSSYYEGFISLISSSVYIS
jgi:hypothetical protein